MLAHTSPKAVMMLKRTIKVVLAEDGNLLRRTLAEHLGAHRDIELLAMAENGAECIVLCRKSPPDVVVLDIRMPVMNGVEAAKILRSEFPDIRILILTTFDDDEYLRELFGLGVDGYLLKSGNPEKLVDAVRNVCKGLGAVDGAISRKLGEMLNHPSAKPMQGPLSETERRVAHLIAEGKYNKEIAVTLGISYGRARNLVSKVYAKLGAADRQDLISKLGNL